MNANRRRLLLGTLAATAASATMAATVPPLLVEVWKSPDCGCCGHWIRHLRANGFQVAVNDVGNDAVRAALGIPAALGSCHTAKVAGYAIEGHVPAGEIRRLLQERPDAIGLAVVGMPIGSPGMEQGGKREPYEVLLVLRGGTARVYGSYR